MSTTPEIMMADLTINKYLVNQLRDKLLDKMRLDDVDVDVVAKYLSYCTIDRLLEINKIAEVLDDWQLVGRIIGNSMS